MDRELIIVLDFGGQYKQLIARRVRECNVYCEIHPYTKTPAEILAMRPRGIILTGGGSQLRGLDERIRKETGLSVNVIDDPMTCVCKGAARILEDLDKYRPVLVASST